MIDLLPALPPPSPQRQGWPWTRASAPLPESPGGGVAWPKISIITPSFNQGDYIEETIRSVLLQNYPNLEYLIMDGGSTDGTQAIIEKYAPFIGGWVSEADGGQTQAINKGLRRSTGEIVGWLNSDDLLLPDALWRIARAFMEGGPEANIVTGFRKTIDAQSRFLRNQFHSPPQPRYLRLVDNIAQETTYWRRALLQSVGELDERFKYAMDYDYWHRVLDAGYSFTLIPYYLGSFRLHEASKGAQWAQVRAEELGQIYGRYGLGSSETEAFAHLERVMGTHWREKEKLMEMLCRRRLSDDPRALLLAFRLLQIPLVSHLLTGVHEYYRAQSKQLKKGAKN